MLTTNNRDASSRSYVANTNYYLYYKHSPLKGPSQPTNNRSDEVRTPWDTSMDTVCCSQRMRVVHARYSLGHTGQLGTSAIIQDDTKNTMKLCPCPLTKATMTMTKTLRAMITQRMTLFVSPLSLKCELRLRAVTTQSPTNNTLSGSSNISFGGDNWKGQHPPRDIL